MKRSDLLLFFLVGNEKHNLPPCVGTVLLQFSPWDQEQLYSGCRCGHCLASQGGAYLGKYDGSPGNTFADHFTMFHLYLCSGQSHRHCHCPGCTCAATPLEVYLHGCWHFKNTGQEAVDLHYVEPTLEERIYLSLLCF